MAQVPISHEDFRDLLLEQAPDTWLVNEAEDLNSHEQLMELLDTGSVTIKVNGKSFVLALIITHETDD